MLACFVKTYTYGNCHLPGSTQYMFAALRDCIPTLKWCKHQESPEVLLNMFESEVDGYMKERILEPLCRDIEEDLRLSTHLHLQLDDRNPFKVSIYNPSLPSLPTILFMIAYSMYTPRLTIGEGYSVLCARILCSQV